MLITVEYIYGNIQDIDCANLRIDEVQMQWFDTHKKLARLQSQSGEILALKLKDDSQNGIAGLNNGDILVLNKQKAIIISIIPIPTLCASFQDWKEVALFCYEIGNLHTPLFFAQRQMEFCIPFETPIQKILQKRNIRFHIKDCILNAKDRLQFTNFLREPKFTESLNFQIHINKKV